MGLVQRRSKRLESVISVCLLILLFLIGVWVLKRQSDYDLGRFGIQSGQVLTNEFNSSKLNSFVPAGFEVLSGPQEYIPENLYEKIDGKAPLYIDSGFERLYTQRFISKASESLWMELFIYDMATLRNAFSVYSVQKRAGVELLPAMQFAYKTSNGIYFVRDRYYIELVGSSESAELSEVMTEAARRIASELAVDATGEIAELSLFPRENLVPGSFKLYLESAFGFERLTDTFAARYNIDGQTITAFFTRRSDSQQAQQMAKSYYKFLLDNGGKAKQTAKKSIKGLQGKVVDFYGATEIVFAIGPFVAGVHEAENQQSAETLAEMLVKALTGAEKNV